MLRGKTAHESAVAIRKPAGAGNGYRLRGRRIGVVRIAPPFREGVRKRISSASPSCQRLFSPGRGRSQPTKEFLMKDSGIEWIGEIPEEWEISPLFSIFKERKQKNYNLKETNILSLSYGKIIRRNTETNMGLLPESFETYNIVDKSNIILRLTDLQNDKTSLRTGLVIERGIITSAYIALESINTENVFFHYLLHCYDELKVFYVMGNGVRQNLKFAELSRLPLLVPPLAEQQRIADYLDAKCAYIDQCLGSGLIN